MLKPLTNATYGVADVIATVADGIATAGWVCLWQMLMPVVDGKSTRVNYLTILTSLVTMLPSTISTLWRGRTRTL